MALLGKFGISGALDKVIASGDLDSPKVESALEKLLENKKDAMKKVIERIDSGPKIQYSISLELMRKLLDNTTIEMVMQALPDFEASALSDVATLLNTSHSYDPHRLLPYLKEPLSISICRDMIMAHRKEFTAAKLLKAVARSKPDLWDIIFELIHGRVDAIAFPEALALTKSKDPTLRKYATDVIADSKNPAAIEALLVMLRDNDRKVYIAALTGLTRMKASIPAARLFHLLQNMQKDDAPLLKALLGHCKDPELMTFINKALFGKSTKLRLLAVQSLAKTASVDNIRAVFMELANKAEGIHEDIIRTLIENCGEPFIDAISKLMVDPEKKISGLAIKAVDISDPANPRIQDIMRLYVGSDIPAGFKKSFIGKLGQARDSAAVQPLTKILRKEPKHRVITLQALEKIADQSALADVFEMLGKDDADIQIAALDCLSAIIPKKFAGQIREQLIENVDRLLEKTLPTLTTLLEKITEQHRLPETAAYTKAIGELKSGASDGFDTYMPSNSDDDPFGELGRTFSGGQSAIFGTGEMTLSKPEETPNEDFSEKLEEGLVLSDRYKLVKEIGRGGYGSVWLVEDMFIQEQLVMKFLHRALVSDEVAIERFVRELRLARKITHANIIRLFDYLNFDNMTAISMEYFPGSPLSSIIHEGALEPARVVKLVKTICLALETAHQAEVVHRDMKPANILVDENNVVKIVDFGIAAASKHAESRLTRTGTLVGTPTYISPEQIQGKAVDGRTDLYSLGIIMYEMLAGQPPYRAEDPMALVFMHIEGNARRLDEVNPIVPTELADIVHRCILPTPDERYQNMAELWQALSEINIS